MNVPKKICAVLLVLALLWCLAGMFSGTLFTDRKRVEANQCWSRLAAARQALLSFKKNKDDWPYSLAELVPDYIEAPRLQCSKGRGFVYFRPAATGQGSAPLLMTSTADYEVNGVRVFLGITVDGSWISDTK